MALGISEDMFVLAEAGTEVYVLEGWPVPAADLDAVPRIWLRNVATAKAREGVH